ncbi:response regulator [Altericista sp. CCNU0014]|uniref:hybrid sensor histidine kinase/response regulator n=1 Tax=Altericista sp. CCNU0014 TaxID=3082949 RepID=UPI00384B23B6
MKKILIIEDELSIRSNILKILSFENFEVIGVDNGELGIKLAQEQNPDLILCDIMMPKVDGYRVRNELSKNPETETIPFIFLTAKVDRTDMRLGMSLGADDYLTKPFSREELLETVFARLDKRAVVHKQYQEKLEQIRGSVATSLPTELFIPLQRVRSFLETIQGGESDLIHPTLVSTAKESYDASLRLEKILQNFLLYALLEVTLQDPLQAATFRGQCATDSANIIAEIAKAKAQQVGRDADLDLQLQPAIVPILEANLAKIVEELLDNAFKFSPPESTVQVLTSLESGQFQLTISDRGQGLSQQELKSIGAYVQFGKKLSGNGGSGLGLTIAKRIVELHGGSLEVHSTPSTQTIVRVTLPISTRIQASNTLAKSAEIAS